MQQRADLGTIVGTDARKLVVDGYPAQNVFACDLHQEFLDHGDQLYAGDARTHGIRFMAADVLELPHSSGNAADVPLAEVKELSQLRGKVLHLYAGNFFHLFDEKTQYDVALRLATLTRREPGMILYGRQIGARKAQALDNA